MSFIVSVNDIVCREGVKWLDEGLGHLRTSLKHQARGDVLGRFLSRIYAFEGIRSAAELCEVMRAYDDARLRDYPDGSGISFTQFFLPGAFRAGWRLSSCATQCWGEFCRVAKDHLSSTGDVQRLQVGMEWVASSIQHVLTHSNLSIGFVSHYGRRWPKRLSVRSNFRFCEL